MARTPKRPANPARPARVQRRRVGSAGSESSRSSVPSDGRTSPVGAAAGNPTPAGGAAGCPSPASSTGAGAAAAQVGPTAPHGICAAPVEANAVCPLPQTPPVSGAAGAGAGGFSSLRTSPAPEGSDPVPESFVSGPPTPSTESGSQRAALEQAVGGHRSASGSSAPSAHRPSGLRGRRNKLLVVVILVVDADPRCHSAHVGRHARLKCVPSCRTRLLRVPLVLPARLALQPRPVPARRQVQRHPRIARGPPTSRKRFLPACARCACSW